VSSKSCFLPEMTDLLIDVNFNFNFSDIQKWLILVDIFLCSTNYWFLTLNCNFSYKMQHWLILTVSFNFSQIQHFTEIYSGYVKSMQQLDKLTSDGLEVNEKFQLREIRKVRPKKMSTLVNSNGNSTDLEVFTLRVKFFLLEFCRPSY
jgi:hypothetical protein